MGPILHTLHPGPSFKTNWPNKRTKETTIRQYVFSDHVFSDHDDDIRWQSPAFVFWLASNHQTSDLHHTAAVCSFPNFRIGEALKRKDVPRTASPRGRWELDIYWISTGYLLGILTNWWLTNELWFSWWSSAHSWTCWTRWDLGCLCPGIRTWRKVSIIIPSCKCDNLIESLHFVLVMIL